MNVLWLSHFLPYPPKGGVLQRSYNLLREIARYHNVYLLAFSQKFWLATTFSNEDEGKEEAYRELSSICAKLSFINIPCEQVRYGRQWLAFKSLFTRHPYSVNWLKSAEMTKLLSDWTREGNIDLVHVDTIGLGPYVSEVRECVRVLNHNDIESHMMLRRARKESNWAKKAYFFQESLRLRSYEKEICPRFDINITCSSLDSSRLRRVIPSLKVAKIPNGVDLDYFQPQRISQTPRSLVFAGNLGWYPNRKAMQFFGSHLWPVIKKEMPDATMNIVGANPPRDLIELTKQDKQIKTHGFVVDVRPYLERAAVYICPITDGGGTRLKILDAFAMEKAVVADPIACEGIDVTPGKDILLASTVGEYLAQIKFLFENEDKRLEIGRNARRLVDQLYSFRNIGKKLSDIYNQCLQHHR